ncbi:MAG: hypothetical protein ACI94Y_003093 [Maribacter sp.]|jgi:hypothetical protein
MKAIHFTLLFLFLLGTQSLISQNPGKLRELGISLIGEYGFTDPVSLSTTAGISPIRTFTRTSEDAWYAKDFNARDKIDFSYSYGASLFFTASTPKFNLVTIEGGFKHSKLVYYYEFDTPLYSPQADAVTHFQEWFYTNQYFANLIYSQHLGYTKSLFLYAKVGGTYSEISSRFLPTRNKNLYDGISASGSTTIGNQDGTSVLEINETVNDTDLQFGILGGLGFELRFGAKKRHALFGGVFYRHNLKTMVNANYAKSENSILQSNDDVKYRGNYYGYEFGYKFPIIPIKDKYGSSSNSKGKGKVTVYLSFNYLGSIGAKWRIDGGQWRNSGESVSVKEGRYLVEFSNVNGWTAPSSTYVDIKSGTVYTTTATYSKNNSNPPPPPPTPPTKPTNPAPQSSDLEKDMQSCFKDKKSDPIYYENDLTVKYGKVEIEIFPPISSGEDGDKISLCVDGELELSNYEINEEGKKISLDMSSKTEILLIIKAESTGSNGKTEIEVQVVTGSKLGDGLDGQKVTLQLQKGDYYYIKVIR